MFYDRHLDLKSLLREKSLLLLGPRQTGKSTLCRRSFPDAYAVNLMETNTFREYSARPELLRERIPENVKTIFIDEAQRVPEIFNEVQVLIDRNSELRFILTGSSARKLRTGGVNLLPGRLWSRHLHPLVSKELGDEDLDERLVKGSLPGIFPSAQYREELRNYVGLYLDQEIRAEALTRSVGDFSRFLTVAALTNTQVINFTKVAHDSEVKLNTVRAYYQILEDTLIGFFVEPFRDTPSRKAVASPKFYFFDLGVVNAILDRYEVKPQTAAYGPALEHLIFLELKAFCDYCSPATSIKYWRTHSKIEVDFLVGEKVAIEVKSSTRLSPSDEKGLHALSEDLDLSRKIIVCKERQPRKTESGVEILPVNHFLKALWSGDIFDAITAY